MYDGTASNSKELYLYKQTFIPLISQDIPALRFK